ncbi:fumarylacetoacetate hydrolase family protein [Actinospica sp.]|uniref:fumarylacetoacetate hydrolase family protein n=1 Tax=Actinospica sp. TaxID=1872142 RepID=UPI002CA64129|nr:fumarylacetoacetate hydrolase family protein [Actinospica sp.]HWG25311.1 fumarylacetoacetate hydrolase family protein [Actinospica sp.]
MRFGVIDNRPVLVDGESAIDIERASGGRFPADPAGIFDRWEALVEWAATAELEGERLPLDRLQNPVPAPRQVFGIGANYLDHAEEAARAQGFTGDVKAMLPKNPMIFTKFRSSLSGPYDAIPLPSRNVDWEVELVVVMGRRAERVAAHDAWSYVAGLTVGQDISERVVQMAGHSPQLSMGKSFPGFGPVGPVLVTPDALENPDDLELGCTLNGQTVQKGRTAGMIFPVAELIAHISGICPLLPGDLIFTGTPSGVGLFRTPPVYLKPGDTLVTWVKGIGELRNPVAAGHGYRADDDSQNNQNNQNS